MRKQAKRLDLDEASSIAANALAFLADDRNRLVRFLSLTGMSPDELREQAQEPAVLGAVLEHLLEDESALLVFTSTFNLDPSQIAPAAAILQGAR